MKKHIKPIRQNLNEMLVHVIIPSAGIGRRMKSYGCKSLLNIKNNSLISLQLDLINDSIPNKEIVLVTGFDSDRLMNNSPDNIIKIENERYYESNVVRSIGMGLRAIKENDHVLIIFGDLLLNEKA
ncbi:MAG: NTP transferase domain-containing protein, partial [Candidatus Hodarchaeales archaeon]